MRRNSEGATPIDEAQRAGHEEAAQLLFTANSRANRSSRTRSELALLVAFFDECVSCFSQ
jgi:hypothetical protein